MDDKSKADLQALLSSQPLAVLSSDGDGQPYSSLVGFAATENLKHILFATLRQTRKYRNIESNPRVSLLVDSRSNSEDDFQSAMAVTILGTARECNEEDEMLQIYLSRHPGLSSFVHSAGCALLCVDVTQYYLVRRFQEVVEIAP